MKKAENFVRLTLAPFSRRGSFMAFFMANGGSEGFGKTDLWLGNTRGGGSLNTTLRQMKMDLVKDGRKLPAVVSSTPYEVILDSEYGSVRFCIGERKLVRCKGTDGLTLRITCAGGGAQNMMDGTWLADFGKSDMLLVPFKGKLSRKGGFELEPDAAGEIDMVFEEYLIDPIHRPLEDYPSYEQCVAAVKAEFDSFAEAVCPKLPEPWEENRLQAAWTTWGLMCDPDGETIIKHTVVKMLRGIFEHISGWQQGMQAIFLSRDVTLAWDILMSCFDYQDANGRIADIYDDEKPVRIAMKPPFQGIALLWLMENRDLSCISTEEKKRCYERMSAWTEFFFKCRDFDKDGLWENKGAVETGWEDAPYFYVGFPLASPDMNAYLALQMEALGKLGKELGEPGAEKWLERSKATVDKIVEKFWTGERWIAFNAETGEKSNTESLPLFAALILGKRLPQEIIDKSIEYIFAPGTFETPFGLASESLKSKFYCGGWCQGSVVTPAQFIFCLAFEACGRRDLSVRVAKEYLSMMKENGYYHMNSAITGKGEDRAVLGDEKTSYWSSWTTSCYLFLADRYGE